MILSEFPVRIAGPLFSEKETGRVEEAVAVREIVWPTEIFVVIRGKVMLWIAFVIVNVVVTWGAGLYCAFPD